MPSLEDLGFELERRSIVFHRDTTMPDTTQLGYVGDPNNAVDGNTPGETLLYYCPSGTRYLDKSVAPYTRWVKVSDDPGGLWEMEASGQAGTTQINHIEVEFTYSDAGSPVSIGIAPLGANVQNTFLEILSPFDDGLQMTIGTVDSLALLMSAEENIPSEVGQYRAANNVKYDGEPEFFVFFNTASPTMGQARATIYFN